MYDLVIDPTFEKSLQRLIAKDSALLPRINKALSLLSQDPRHPSLNSHKVNTRRYGVRWSSWVTGDLRLIWDFDEHETIVILILDIGGHSGKRRVYS